MCVALSLGCLSGSMDPDSLVYRREVRKRKKSYINAYMWNLDNGIDDLICKAERETDS